MLTKEQLTDAYEQGLSISTKSDTKLKIVANLMDIFAIQYYNSTKIEWFSIEKFNELQCTIEQPKPKIDLSILKEGEIYYAKANTSEIVFKHKGRNTKIHSYAMYFISYNKTFTNYSMCNIDSITELRLPTESELELFYSKFPDLKPKPKYNGRAVKCDTVEQANYIATNRKFTYNFNEEDLDQFIYINLNIDEWDGGDYYNENNYEIISFSDYCKENGIKEPKWIQGFEVGKDYNDVVMVCDDNLSWELGRLIKVENDSFPFILDSDCSWKYCRYPRKNEINEIKFSK